MFSGPYGFPLPLFFLPLPTTVRERLTDSPYFCIFSNRHAKTIDLKTSTTLLVRLSENQLIVLFILSVELERDNCSSLCVRNIYKLYTRIESRRIAPNVTH